MDEQKNNEDADSENVNLQSADIDNAQQVKTPETSVEPIINDVQTPPDPETVIKDDDIVAVNSAINSIEINSDEDAPKESSAEKTEEESPLPESDTEENSPMNEPSLREAPNFEEKSSSEKSETTEETKNDPFVVEKSDNIPTAIPVALAETQSVSNNEQSFNNEHKNNKKFAVTVIVIISLLIMSVVIYIYVSTQGNTTKITQESNNNTSQTAETSIAPATAEDVARAVNDVDSIVGSIDDTTDLNEKEISDETLGL